jgi:PEP-CTERM motif
MCKVLHNARRSRWRGYGITTCKILHFCARADWPPVCTRQNIIGPYAWLIWGISYFRPLGRPVLSTTFSGREKMSKRLILLFVFSLICVGCLPIRADTITDPTNGVAYTLTYSPTANPNVFDLKLVIDTTNYSRSLNNTLADIALNLIGQGAVVSDFALTSSPNNSYQQPQAGGLNAGGCNGQGAPSLCDNYIGAGSGLAVGPGNVYTWDWAYTGSFSDLMTASHIKAQYSGQGAGLTSQAITLSEFVPPPPPPPPVPEPATLLLVGSGLATAVKVIRSRRSPSH